MRKFFRSAAVALTAIVALAGCSTGSTDSDDSSSDSASSAEVTGEFPVTIKHVYGETTIEKAPQRVATVGWVNMDVALALGVVPVGMPTDEWGGNDDGSTPWKDEALADLDAEIGTDAAPAQYSEADGINFNEIAKTEPDIILAVVSGITLEDYDKLTEIAPVIAYPEIAWGTSWQDATTIIGEALGMPDAAADLVTDTEKKISDAAAEYPQIQGATYIAANLEPEASDGINIYSSIDSRPRFLDELGLKMAPVVTEAEKSAEPGFFIPWSPENAGELESDILLTWSSSDDTIAAIKADPLLSQIPAVKNDTMIALTDQTLTLASSASSPLSLPWALDQYLPLIADAVDKASA